MTAFPRQVARIKPALIEGYVGAMLELADFCADRGLGLSAPRAVATTAAPLSATSRQRLEDAFGAPVYDEYRSAEFGWTAGECRAQDGLHVFADARLLEVVRDDGTPAAPGETGDVVITDLTNRVFPMIRYRLGDRAALLTGPCACGVTLPRMSQVDGRTTDLLRLPGGRSVGHRLLAMFSVHPEAVRLFQIHQQADHSVVVRVVPGTGPEATTKIEAAVEALRDRLQHAVPVSVQYVDRLPYTGGKVKYVISDVPAS